MIVTGMCIATDFFPVRSSVYEKPAPPPPREWVNRDGYVWCLIIEYRKPSLGDAGVLGTYRTHERAKKALAEHVERELTAEELSEGAVYGEDETVEIVEQALED